MKHRIEHLDAMRGIAALLVVVQHGLERTTQYFDAPWIVLDAVNLGRFGVVLFFLISGFVIPFSFRGDQPIRNFAISRTFRLLPALWLSVALLLLVKGPAPLDVVIANMAMIARPLGLPELSGVYWTLSYELGFYIVCALVFWKGSIFDHRLQTGAITLLLACCFLWGIYSWIYFCYMFLGMLMRLAFLEGNEGAKRLWKTYALLLAGSAILLTMQSPGSMFLKPVATTVAMVLPIAIFTAAIAWKPDVPGWLVWLGKISYSVYLLQSIALHACKPLAAVSIPLYLSASIAMVIAMAALSYQLVEEPLNRFGKRLTRKPQPLAA
ncbi:MAG: acyltransferase [Novosphingobium sp.]|nr:acyltransferase [Novosphingobium sp.]